MAVVDKEVTSPASPIVVRPSSDDDVPAMLDIYRHHIAHGVGSLGAFEPTPFDADDLKARPHPTKWFLHGGGTDAEGGGSDGVGGLAQAWDEHP